VGVPRGLATTLLGLLIVERSFHLRAAPSEAAWVPDGQRALTLVLLIVERSFHLRAAPSETSWVHDGQQALLIYERIFSPWAPLVRVAQAPDCQPAFATTILESFTLRFLNLGKNHLRSDCCSHLHFSLPPDAGPPDLCLNHWTCSEIHNHRP
jgi:hypothetical protein